MYLNGSATDQRQILIAESLPSFAEKRLLAVKKCSQPKQRLGRFREQFVSPYLNLPREQPTNLCAKTRLSG
ncbi:MAG: hypothetical protein KatS3mg113_0949 [Planctomycetaceae bacterium]|nr:MAG: hypothetical protein KatS3mg113_0949 [Planctomycetaceae bacterium]